MTQDEMSKLDQSVPVSIACLTDPLRTLKGSSQLACPPGDLLPTGPRDFQASTEQLQPSMAESILLILTAHGSFAARYNLLAALWWTFLVCTLIVHIPIGNLHDSK